MRVIYITRTYASDENTSNCTGYRNYTVTLLKKKYDVLVVTPGYETDAIQDKNGVVSIPYKFRRTDMWLERLGVNDDYLQRWVDDAFAYLKGRLSHNDIIMAVSGGELGCIMLAACLKEDAGCKMMVNFHDPVDATVIRGKKSTLKFHVNRDRVLGKYLKCADEIITCSETYKEVILEKYGDINPCIHNVYMGFRGKVEKIASYKRHGIMHLVYAGTMSPTQRAERFIDLVTGMENVEIIYIGNVNESIRKAADKIPNVKVVPPMPHDKYVQFIMKEADIGLVALNGEEFGACVPSKIFELINLEIPILAIMPDGDAKEIINSGYGYACYGDDKQEIQQALRGMIEKNKLESIKANMRRDKSKWQMDRLFEDVYRIIDEMAENNEEKS